MASDQDRRERPRRERHNPYRQQPQPMPGSEPHPMHPPKRQRSNLTAQLIRAGGIGTDFALAVAIMGGCGWLMDWALGTRPLLAAVGLIVGIIAGFIRFVRAALAESNRGPRPKP